ncbi:zinc-finger domain-containing protein [Bacillus pseudomycoides]|uniref:Zinc-finger domain-containing protein n=1 Tax=Bacillus bingmayongensis TaxID=1150157 RepID=A0ABU5JUF1_9BACI|nr:zinc-finger domain-containing protein [Bacillus pseudomycoides]
MNKAAIRLDVINLQDNHCKSCEHRYDRNAEYCWNKCEIGKRMNNLGVYLGGQNAKNKKKIRTAKDWDELCIKAATMREEGMSYNEIAKVLGVVRGEQIRFQLKKRMLN